MHSLRYIYLSAQNTPEKRYPWWTWAALHFSLILLTACGSIVGSERNKGSDIIPIGTPTLQNLDSISATTPTLASISTPTPDTGFEELNYIQSFTELNDGQDYPKPTRIMPFNERQTNDQCFTRNPSPDGDVITTLEPIYIQQSTPIPLDTLEPHSEPEITDIDILLLQAESLQEELLIEGDFTIGLIVDAIEIDKYEYVRQNIIEAIEEFQAEIGDEVTIGLKVIWSDRLNNNENNEFMDLSLILPKIYGALMN